MSHTILLVEADEPTCLFLSEQLTADGHDLLVAGSAQGAVELAQALPVALVVIGDLADRAQGRRLLDDLRAGVAPFDPALAVLVLTAQAGELDVVRWFEHGADDVLGRPFAYAVLRARIAALLRRSGRQPFGELVRVGPLEIDIRARLARLAGEPLALTAREWALLVALASDPERVHTKAELMLTVWGWSDRTHTRTLDSHASRLRAKLSAGGDQRWVISRWGVGYSLIDATLTVVRAA